MTNREIAAVLFNVSSILSAQHGNPYRIRAYRRAALHLLRQRDQIADRVAQGRPLGIPRLGKSLTAKISALASQGHHPFYSQICAELPPEEQKLLALNIPSIGPTIAARIHRDLGRTDAASLRRAAATGSLQRIWGMGPKRTAALLGAVGGSEVQQICMEL